MWKTFKWKRIWQKWFWVCRTKKKVSRAWRNWVKEYSIRRILEVWWGREATLTGNFSKDFLLLMISLIFCASKHSSEKSQRLSLQLRLNPAFFHFFNISSFHFFRFQFLFPLFHRIKALLVVLYDHILETPILERNGEIMSTFALMLKSYKLDKNAFCHK